MNVHFKDSGSLGVSYLLKDVSMYQKDVSFSLNVFYYFLILLWFLAVYHLLETTEELSDNSLIQYLVLTLTS